MERLTYRFACLDGLCIVEVFFDETLRYTIQSTIPEIKSCDGELAAAETAAFREALKKAHLEGWDREYLPTAGRVEDAVEWEVTYQNDTERFSSKGEETYEPYDHPYLIKALMLIDPILEYFLI